MESCGPTYEEVVAQEDYRGSPNRKQRIMCTNVNELVSSLLKFRDYLRINKPDVCLTHTLFPMNMYVPF